MSNKKIVIIDIDGVIADSNWRVQFLPSRYLDSFEDDRHPDWDEYQSKSALDEPIYHIKRLLDVISTTDVDIFLLTARPEKWRNITEDWLHEHYIQYDTLIMKDNNSSSQASEYKLEICRHLKKDHEIIFVLDDFDDVIKSLRLENFPAFHFKHYKEKSLLYRNISKITSSKLLITITGPTCSGKTTFLLNLMKEDKRFIQITSTTTRPKREGENSGSHYYFVNDEEFDNTEMLERVTFAGYRYGAALKDFNSAINSNKIPVLIVEPNGVMQINEYCEQHKDIQHIKVFIATSTSTTMQRLLKRQIEDLKPVDTEEKLAKVLQIYTERVIAHMTVERHWQSITYWNYIVPEYTEELQTSAISEFIDWLNQITNLKDHNS